MPRRGGGMPVPEGVHAVRAGKRTYYYWHPHRGAPNAGKAIPLGTDPTDPEFWVKLNSLRGSRDGISAWTFDALIRDYRASSKFLNRRKRTQEHYEHQLQRISDSWGSLPVSELSTAGIFALRAKYERTPVAANHLITMLRTILGWGLAHNYCTTNLARDIVPLEIDDERNAKPWPDAAYELVLRIAPERIRRSVYLARATGQRRSDVVGFGKRHRRDDGIAIKIGKLRDRDHVIPLMAHQIEELDSWSCSDTGPWVVSPTGEKMSGDNVQSTLKRLIEKTPELRKHDLKMHGLRANAAIDRKLAGAENRAIGASIRMSTAMVERYIKHIDDLALARGVRDQMEAKNVLQRAK